MRIGWSTCRTLQFTRKGFYFHFPRSLARRRSFGSSRYPPLYVKVTRDEERLRGRLLLSHKKRLYSLGCVQIVTSKLKLISQSYHVSNISVYCDPYKVTNKMAPYCIPQFHSLKTWTENNVCFVCLFACFVLFCFFFVYVICAQCTK